MNRRTETRQQQTPTGNRLCGLVLTLLSVTAVRAVGQNGQQQHPAPIVRQAPSRVQAPTTSQFGQPGRSPHLAQWMESHRSMPLEQQQRALQAEPGFQQLDPSAQQRMHERLSQLNSMSPEQRQRVINRTEAMERLQPEQRQQVRSAMQGLGALPEDRRRIVARTFRNMRDMPQAQRENYLNSPQMRGQFSPNERETLDGLFHVAPLLPPPATPPPGPQAPR